MSASPHRQSPASSEAPPPQPLLLSASVYCQGLLDELLQRAVAPFWRQVEHEAAPQRYALWMLRYSRRGEHLKLRVHGPSAADVGWLRQRLSEHVEPFLAGLGPPDPQAVRLSELEISPLDPEDEGVEPYPDRTLRWTHYAMPASHLGREPLSAAPGFAEGYVHCVSSAAAVVLSQWEQEPVGGVRPGTRLSVLLRLMLSALEALELSPAEELESLLYHRDWLLLGSNASWHSAVAFLERKAQASKPQLAQLEGAATRRHSEPRAPSQAQGPLARWQEAMHVHFHNALSALGASAYRGLDRDQRHQLLAALARVLHNTANLLRVDLSNEIHLCHLLSCSLRPLLESEVPLSSFLVNPASVSQP